MMCEKCHIWRGREAKKKTPHPPGCEVFQLASDRLGGFTLRAGVRHAHPVKPGLIIIAQMFENVKPPR